MEQIEANVEVPDKIREIAQIAGRSHPSIVEVRLFGRYAEGSQTESSDIDIAVLVDKKAPPGDLSNEGPVAKAVRESLEKVGIKVGKEPGEVDIEIAGSGILELDADSAATITRAVLNGRRLFP